MTKFNMPSSKFNMPSSKNVGWSYYKELKVIDDMIELSGFRSSGSIQTNQAIEYNEYLNLKFKAFIYKNPEKEAAILDIDFWDKGKKNNKSFVSITLDDDVMSVIIKEESRPFFARKFNMGSGWKTFNINLDHNKISILVDQDLIEYVFKDQHKKCTIAFGNNGSSFLDKTIINPSLNIKEVLVETENGSFPLIINNLNILQLY